MRLGPFAGMTSYDHALAFCRNPFGKAFVFAVVALFVWHGAHRIYHSLHDFGIHTGLLAKLACYGFAFAVTVAAAAALLSIGFYRTTRTGVSTVAIVLVATEPSARLVKAP